VSVESITASLQRFADGEKEALDRLLPLLYSELQKLARGHLRNERAGHTLQPTALVHEAYMRLVKQDHPFYRSRAHFMGVAAQVMRQILIDHARTRNAAKRGGGEPPFSIGIAGDIPVDRPSALIAIDDALKELGRRDAIKAQLIEMRFFGGMTAEESAEATGLVVSDIRSHLRVGQAWLRSQLDLTGGDTASARSAAL